MLRKYFDKLRDGRNNMMKEKWEYNLTYDTVKTWRKFIKWYKLWIERLS